MGLEKKVDRILEEEGVSADHFWSNGLCCSAEDAPEILEALECSFAFGPVRYNPKTGRIEFGVHYQHMRHKTPDDYAIYVNDFLNFRDEV